MRKTFTTLAVAAIVAAAPAAFAQDKVLFKTPTTFNTELPGLGTPLPRVAEAIDVLSDGNMKMRVYEPGELVAPFEILDAVSTGKINSGWATAGYWAAKIPASPLFSAVPFGPEAGEGVNGDIRTFVPRQPPDVEEPVAPLPRRGGGSGVCGRGAVGPGPGPRPLPRAPRPRLR